MISVIVPVYNVEKHLSRCIESVIAQEYPDWELILVDDGSPDRSGEICDEYAKKDERIRVIHQENQGASSTRNNGIQEAKGDYLCFMDSDDYVTPQYLSDFEPEIDIDFAIQGMTSVFISGKEPVAFIPGHSEELALLGLLQERSVFPLIQGPCCKLYKTSILKNNKIFFPIELSYSEDGVFVMNYLRYCRGKIFVKAKSNYFYTHETASSLTAKFHKGLELYQAVLAQFQQYEALSNAIGHIPEAYESYYRQHLAIDFYQAIYNAWVDNEYSLGDKLRMFRICDCRLWRFIKSENCLPKGFGFLKLICSLSLLGH